MSNARLPELGPRVQDPGTSAIVGKRAGHCTRTAAIRPQGRPCERAKHANFLLEGVVGDLSPLLTLSCRHYLWWEGGVDGAGKRSSAPENKSDQGSLAVQERAAQRKTRL